jgi:hypothetical protein
MVGLSGKAQIISTCKDDLILFYQRPKKLVQPTGIEPVSKDFQSSA